MSLWGGRSEGDRQPLRTAFCESHQSPRWTFRLNLLDDATAPDDTGIDVQAQGFCDLHVQHDLDSRMALNRQMRCLSSLQYSVNELRRRARGSRHIGVYLKQRPFLRGKGLAHGECN